MTTLAVNPWIQNSVSLVLVQWTRVSCEKQSINKLFTGWTLKGRMSRICWPLLQQLNDTRTLTAVARTQPSNNLQRWHLARCYWLGGYTPNAKRLMPKKVPNTAKQEKNRQKAESLDTDTATDFNKRCIKGLPLLTFLKSIHFFFLKKIPPLETWVLVPPLNICN